MYETEMLFEDLDIGDFFEFAGDLMQKISAHKRPRYGNVNCRLVRMRYYAGDTGYRQRWRRDVVRKRGGE